MCHGEEAYRWWAWFQCEGTMLTVRSYHILWYIVLIQYSCFSHAITIAKGNFLTKLSLPTKKSKNPNKEDTSMPHHDASGGNVAWRSITKTPRMKLKNLWKRLRQLWLSCLITGKRELFPIWKYSLERGWSFKIVN